MAQSKTTSRIVIGLFALAGAAALLWFNAGVRLSCQRHPPGEAAVIDCLLERDALDVIPLRSRPIADVIALERRRGVASGGRSGTTTIAIYRYAFVTASGAVEPGYFADLFAAEPNALDAFFADAQQSEAMLQRSALQQWPGNAAAALLALLGVFVLASALRSVRR